MLYETKDIENTKEQRGGQKKKKIGLCIKSCVKPNKEAKEKGKRSKEKEKDTLHESDDVCRTSCVSKYYSLHKFLKLYNRIIINKYKHQEEGDMAIIQPQTPLLDEGGKPKANPCFLLFLGQILA